MNNTINEKFKKMFIDIIPKVADDKDNDIYHFFLEDIKVIGYGSILYVGLNGDDIHFFCEQEQICPFEWLNFETKMEIYIQLRNRLDIKKNLIREINRGFRNGEDVPSWFCVQSIKDLITSTEGNGKSCQRIGEVGLTGTNGEVEEISISFPNKKNPCYRFGKKLDELNEGELNAILSYMC